MPVFLWPWFITFSYYYSYCRYFKLQNRLVGLETTAGGLGIELTVYKVTRQNSSGAFERSLDRVAFMLEHLLKLHLSSDYWCNPEVFLELLSNWAPTPKVPLSFCSRVQGESSSKCSNLNNNHQVTAHRATHTLTCFPSYLVQSPVLEKLQNELAFQCFCRRPKTSTRDLISAFNLNVSVF